MEYQTVFLRTFHSPISFVFAVAKNDTNPNRPIKAIDMAIREKTENTFSL